MHSASCFLIFKNGPVAQLGARFHGMEEVVGSIPTRSTKSPTKQPDVLFRPLVPDEATQHILQNVSDHSGADTTAPVRHNPRHCAHHRD
jgi:hypothetical protein